VIRNVMADSWSTRGLTLTGVAQQACGKKKNCSETEMTTCQTEMSHVTEMTSRPCVFKSLRK